MYYVFNSDGSFSAKCDYEVNQEDLEKNGQTLVFVENDFPWKHPVLVNGEIKEYEPTLDDRRKERLVQLKTTRDYVNQNGVKVKGHWFQTDAASLARLKDIAALKEIPTGTLWYDMDKKTVPLTKALIKQVLDTHILTELSNYATYQAHKQVILEHDEPEAYDIATGWTMCYGDELHWHRHGKEYGSFEEYASKFKRI